MTISANISSTHLKEKHEYDVNAVQGLKYCTISCSGIKKWKMEAAYSFVFVFVYNVCSKKSNTTTLFSTFIKLK